MSFNFAGKLDRSKLFVVVFDVNDRLHLDFIVAAANLRSKIYGIEQLYDRKEIAEIIMLAEKTQNEYLIPTEIWYIVFSYLRLGDLKNVSLVCKEFYEIIAVSTELMKKFQISLAGESDPIRFHRIMGKSSRKHQKLKIKRVDLDSLALEFFIDNPIRDLVLAYTDCSEDKLLQILHAVKTTLETITLRDAYVRSDTISDSTYDREQPIIEWKKLKIVKLWGLQYRALDYLPSNIQEIEYFCYGSDHVVSPVDYISKQKKLRKFRLINLLANRFESPLEFSTCEFKLDFLELMQKWEDGPFLQSQYDYLKIIIWSDLSLEYQALAAVINQMKMLERLELQCEINFPQNENPIRMSCPTLKIFNYSGDRLKVQETRLLLQGFPNLEDLAGSDLAPPALVALLISKYNKKLKILELNLTNEMIRVAVMPNLLEFQISENLITDGNINAIRCFFQSCPNIEKIMFWCWDPITQYSFETILKETKNLKVLIVRNGSELPGNVIELNEHLLKKLTTLKIYKFSGKVEEANTILGKHLGLRSFITALPEWGE